MNKIIKTICAVLAACTSLLAFPSCKKDKNPNVLQICEVTHSVFYAPMYLAESLGYFQQEGILIELTNGGGADAVMASVLSGDSDIGFCGPEAALYVLVGGSTDTPKVFGQLTKRDGSFLVSRVPEPDFQWTDLKGKEILYNARVLYMVGTYSGWIFPKPTGSNMAPEAARHRLQGEAGRQFDPELVEKFLRYLEEEEPIE